MIRRLKRLCKSESNFSCLEIKRGRIKSWNRSKRISNFYNKFANLVRLDSNYLSWDAYPASNFIIVKNVPSWRTIILTICSWQSIDKIWNGWRYKNLLSISSPTNNKVEALMRQSLRTWMWFVMVVRGPQLWEFGTNVFSVLISIYVNPASRMGLINSIHSYNWNLIIMRCQKESNELFFMLSIIYISV